MGIRVGKNLKMITKHPLKGPVVIEVNAAHTSLALSIANKIVVGGRKIEKNIINGKSQCWQKCIF